MIHGASDTAPPRVFTWDTYRLGSDGMTFGACGSTTDRRRAMQCLGDALRDAPAGACGVVFKVEVDPIGTAKYRYGGIIARAQHDASSGCVVWSKDTQL
jgi:hypothetical protein